MKSKRALVIGLVVSIALNLVAVGIFLGSQAGPRPEMQRIDPVFGLRRLLGEVPEERAQALAPLYREYFATMRPRFREIRATQAALRNAMLTEPLDEAALRSAMQSFESQLRGSQQASQDAFVTLVAELTLAERQQLVETMSRRPDRWRKGERPPRKGDRPPRNGERPPDQAPGQPPYHHIPPEPPPQ